MDVKNYPTIRSPESRCYACQPKIKPAVIERLPGKYNRERSKLRGHTRGGVAPATALSSQLELWNLKSKSRSVVCRGPHRARQGPKPKLERSSTRIGDIARVAHEAVK